MDTVHPRPESLTLKQRIGTLLLPRLPITRFLFDILRDETAAWIVRGKNACLPWRRSRLRRVRAMRDVCVNVACGPQATLTQTDRKSTRLKSSHVSESRRRL